MIYGYLRVSSDDQDVKSQKQGVEQFASQKNWTIEKYISDEGVSGGKDPSKRKLGPLLESLEKDDIIIVSEISRLGRDLYMVMDILHYCMKKGVIIYTVKDKFVLGDDIQSKVLAFAFGLAAEIERQMIRMRTKEGLRLRMKLGVLLGRGYGVLNSKYTIPDSAKDEIIKALEWGASSRGIAKKLGVDRTTLWRQLKRWNVTCTEKEFQAYTEKEMRRKKAAAAAAYKETPPCIVELPRAEVTELIKQDLTIPQIQEKLPQFTYEQIYDTIQDDIEWNQLYRKHGQIKARKKVYEKIPKL